MVGVGAGWALAALALTEAGARQWPLLAGGLAPLAAVLVLAGALRAPMPGWSAAIMLPSMAALPAMGAWCSAAGWSPAAMALVHTAAMLLPPLLLRAPAPAACRALLLAGGAALLLPGLQGLMLAALLHAAAAGVACAGAQPGRSRGVPLGLAAAVLVVGLAVDRFGPAAAVALHAAMALAALAPWRRRVLSACPA